uniref:HTH araC/xylS-type domain-containing protein n=1 Tax=Heterorhabditis bacteriophora TaxID=37862 RepID=A0A1I7WHZ2_HETBA
MYFSILVFYNVSLIELFALQSSTCTSKERRMSRFLRSCVTRMAVHRTVKRYEEFGTEWKTQVCEYYRVRKMVKKRILRANEGSMRKLASDLNISPISMRKIVKNELGFYPYEIRRAHMSTEKMQTNRG